MIHVIHVFHQNHVFHVKYAHESRESQTETHFNSSEVFSLCSFFLQRVKFTSADTRTAGVASRLSTLKHNKIKKSQKRRKQMEKTVITKAMHGVWISIAHGEDKYYVPARTKETQTVGPRGEWLVPDERASPTILQQKRWPDGSKQKKTRVM